MNIEISPWCHVETSVTVQQQQQLLLPNDSNSNPHDKSSLPMEVTESSSSATTTNTSLLLYDVAASFIESGSIHHQHYQSYQTKRKRQKLQDKKQQHSSTGTGNDVKLRALETVEEDRRPVVAIASQHHISVLVEQQPQSSNNNIQESSILQFHSRPNYNTKNNMNTTKNHKRTVTVQQQQEEQDERKIPPTIPPVYDIHEHRMYSVQQPQCESSSSTTTTKIVCYYNTENGSSTDDPHGRHGSLVAVSTFQQQCTCEVTVVSGPIRSLSILYIPLPTQIPTTTTTTSKRQRRNSNSSTSSTTTTCSSILYGTTMDWKVFIVMTQPSTSIPQRLQLIIQYIDTPYTTTIRNEKVIAAPIPPNRISSSPYNNNNKKKNDNGGADGSKSTVGQQQQQHHAGTIAVICKNSTTKATTNDSSRGNAIICFYQILYATTIPTNNRTATSMVQLIRQHVRLTQEPIPAIPAKHNEQITTWHISSSCTSDDQQYCNTNTPIDLYNNDDPYQIIDDVKVLGTTIFGNGSTIYNDDNSSSSTPTIVLSYRRRHCGQYGSTGTSTQHGMNGSSSRYDCFYATISTAATTTVVGSRTRSPRIVPLSTFPFAVPRLDSDNDAIQQACLVGPSIIGALSQKSKQIYLYDLHRGGLIHIAQPFVASRNKTNNNIATATTSNDENGTSTPSTICISFLADIKRSKLAMIYISPNNPTTYSIAYASIGLNNNNKRSSVNVPQLSLADGLVAAASSTIIATQLRPECSSRMLFPSMNKLVEFYQTETMIPQQNAIQNAIRLLDDIGKKINASAVESYQPSYIIKAFDGAMQSVLIDCDSHRQTSSKNNLVTNGPENGKRVPSNQNDSPQLRNGSNEDIGRDSKPLKGIKKNGEKLLNGFHKKSDILSSKTVKDQSQNGNENSHTLVLMDASPKVRTKHHQYQISELPQVLIDAATNAMISILNRQVPNPDAVHSIRNDARIILRRLIRSGKISARDQLNFVPTEGSPIGFGRANFMQCLRSLELSPSEHKTCEVWSAYTPFDLICDMFDNCADVSERQMIIALRYTLFNARPVDIASYFVRNKNLNDTSLRNKCLNLLSMLKKDPKGSIILQHKMVASGAAYIVYRILKFSIGFNVALLRNAFESNFDSKEFHVVLRLQLEMLANPDKFHLPVTSSIPMKNLLQFTVTLCDCIPTFRDGDSGIDENILDHGIAPRMKNLSSMLTSGTGRLLSVQALVQESIDIIIRENEIIARRRELTTQQQHINPQTSVIDQPKPTPATSLPPYQIERLLF